MSLTERVELLGFVATVLHLLGVAAAVHAVMTARTSQGAIAWAILLVTFPYLTLPAYLVFGRGKFQGYVRARRAGDSELGDVARSLEEKLREFRCPQAKIHPDCRALERLAKMPFTQQNDARLLIDGDQTFAAMFAAIESAQRYILVQFYIIRDDEIGQDLKARLLRKAAQGVRIYLLYDEIGSIKLPSSYCLELVAAGVQVFPFRTSRGFLNRFQLNFRNHRKILIADGRVAYVGGTNVGDEYLGRNPAFGRWRDTHVEITGPAVQAIQFTFLEDWHWATHEVPELEWEAAPAETADRTALVLATGPADVLETCGLFFVHAINSARRRIWIATPYFVPDEQLVAALQLAALRGVDVRIMLPERPDHLLVHLSSFSYIAEAAPTGVKFYRFQNGFLHQKVLLVDDDFAAVSTANLDNRSIRLNFELTVLLADPGFSAAVSEMLENDFAQCRPARTDDLVWRGYWFRVAVRVSRLLSPVQ